MARTKVTANLATQPSKDASPSHSSPTHSQTLGSTPSSGTPTPQNSPISKRISKPTEKVRIKDKGKGIATEPEKKKRKNPPNTEKILKDAIKSSKLQSSKDKDSSPKAKKFKKNPSTSKALDLLLLIPNKEAREKYLQHFSERKITDARVVDFQYFDSNGFVFQNILRAYGMSSFLGTVSDFYPRLIRIFYSNFKLLDDGFESEVRGKKIVFTFQEFATFTGLDYYGHHIDGRVSEDSEENAWERQFDRRTAVTKIMLDGFVERTSLPVGKMDVQFRLLHYVLVRILVPRTGNFAVVQNHDLPMMWGMVNQYTMSWAWIVIATMHSASTTSGATLPYPQLITKILKKFKISVAGEETITNNPYFGEAIIHQMKLKKVSGEWQRKATIADSDDEDQQQNNTDILQKLLQNQTDFINSQLAHNARVETALTDLRQRIGVIEVHLRLQMTFEDIADLGNVAAQTHVDTQAGLEVPAPAEPNLPKDSEQQPLGEGTLAEANTAVSTSSPANRED